MILTFKQKKLILVGVLYYMPEYENLLQTFYWQTEDFVPDIPRVHKFLDYWKDNIEATIKEIVVSEAVTRKSYTATPFFKVIN